MQAHGAAGLRSTAADDEKLSDVELVGVSDSVRLFEALYGGAVFSGDAVERLAFFDDVSRFACRRPSRDGDGELLSDGKAVGIGNPVEARELQVGDTVASRDGEQGFSFADAMRRRTLCCLAGLGGNGGSRCGLGCRVAACNIRISRHDAAHRGDLRAARYLVAFDAFVGRDGAKANFAALLTARKQNCRQESGTERGNREKERNRERNGKEAAHAPIVCSGAEGCKQGASKQGASKQGDSKPRSWCKKSDSQGATTDGSATP